MKDYLSKHPCVDCGENDIRVLEFDHLGDKTKSISDILHGNMEKLQNEIKKCEVVCANCHKIRTYERIGSYRMY